MKIWLPMVFYLFIQSITPGPNNLTCLYLGGKYGLPGSRKFMIASMLSLFVKSMICGSLNLILAKVMPSVVNVLKWFGAAYMLYLAWQMAKSGWDEELSMSGQQTESTYRSGVVLQLLNGKSWIAALSLFAVYVTPIDKSFGAVAFASIVFFAVAASCSLVWAVFGSVLKKVIDRHRKVFGIIMALSLVYCAIAAVL